MKRDKIDDLFSKYIRLLCAGICSKCHKYFGLTRGLHCAHYHSRGKKSVRFYRGNATALCTHCHFYLDHNPLEKQEFFRKLLGTRQFNALEKRANTPRKWTKEELELLEADLKIKIRKLED